jgi:hypothetical protein
MAIIRRGTAVASPVEGEQTSKGDTFVTDLTPPLGSAISDPTQPEDVNRLDAGTGTATGDGTYDPGYGNRETPRDRYTDQSTMPTAPGGVPREGLPGEGAQASMPSYTAPPPASKEPWVPQPMDPSLSPDLTAPTPPPEATSAPAMPTDPTPIAGSPGAPYTSSPGYTPPASIVRKSLTGAPSLPSSNLLGKAGGLLGGGLGVPAIAGNSGPDVSALIQQMLRQRG